MNYNKKFFLFFIAGIIVTIAFFVYQPYPTSGTITDKYKTKRWDTIYIFELDNKYHYEAGHLNYKRYKIGDYFKSGLE